MLFDGEVRIINLVLHSQPFCLAPDRWVATQRGEYEKQIIKFRFVFSGIDLLFYIHHPHYPGRRDIRLSILFTSSQRSLVPYLGFYNVYEKQIK